MKNRRSLIVVKMGWFLDGGRGRESQKGDEGEAGSHDRFSASSL
jgi:hypothetical protein